MKPFKSSPLILHKTSDEDLYRVACPICKSVNVTFLLKNTMTINGPVTHGTKGGIAGSILSLVATCAEHHHHFVIRLGNHNGIGLVWTDVPSDEEQMMHKLSVAIQAKGELVETVLPAPTDLKTPEQCAHGQTCPDCGGEIAEVPKVNAPDNGSGICPSGIHIANAVAALKSGQSPIACLKCPVLGCPANPRNGTDAQAPEDLVPGCPWSVEHYAVMTSWEKGTDLNICMKCPNTACQVHPDFNSGDAEPEAYDAAHYAPPSTPPGVYKPSKEIVDKITSKEFVDKINALKAKSNQPETSPAVPPPAPVAPPTFALLPRVGLTPQDLTTMRTLLEQQRSESLNEAEKTWASRLLMILQHPSANRSAELYASFQRMKKARKEAGLPEHVSAPPVVKAPAPPAPPLKIASSALLETIKNSIMKVGAEAGQDMSAVKTMQIEDYIVQLQALIESKATPREVAEANQAHASLVAYLVEKMKANSESISAEVRELLAKLSTANTLQGQFPKCAVVTDLPAPKINPKKKKS